MKMPNMMVTTLAVIVVVGLLGFFTRETEDRVVRDTVGLELGVPVEHPLLKEYKTISMPVVLRLVNNTDQKITLTADGPCKIFRFVITTKAGQFIQAVRQPETCTQSETTSSVEAQSVTEEIRQIPIATGRYTSGDYILRVKFWNHEGSAPFRLVSN